MSESAGALALTEIGPEALDDLLRKVDQYEFVRITCTDLMGSQRGFVYSKEAARRAIESGGIEAFNSLLMLGPNSTVPKIKEQISKRGRGNGLLFPDPSTFHCVPWSGDGEYKVAEVLCEGYWLPDKTPQMACPRYVCRQQLARLHEEGYKLKSGFELEFILEDAKTGKPVFEGKRIASHICMVPQEKFFFQAKRYFESIGIHIERFHVEGFSSGQFELVTGADEGVHAADNTFILKQGLKELATKKGLLANFMCKPTTLMDGSYLHFNHSLCTLDGQSAFYDDTKPDQLSDVARHWLAGLLAHGKALTAICSPTVNCYRGLHIPSVPHLINWAIDDRLEVSYRVKNRCPKSTLIENRLCSGLCNPYLVMAANVAAGLDGVRRKLECPPARQEDGVEVVPYSLEEALEALEADRILVEALGEEVVEWFIQIKRQIELPMLKDSDVMALDDENGLKAERALYALLM